MQSSTPDADPPHGILVVAGAPIGNVADASSRLGDYLRSADVIAAEDTRRLRRLVSDLGIPLPGLVVSYYEAVEQRRIPDLLNRLHAGQTVLVISDAGMPAVSDPGYRLVAAASAAGIAVTAVPGPSAVLTALAVSGLPSDRFAFEGFPPRRSGERGRWLEGLATEQRTWVFFESPRRIATTLAEAAQSIGPQRPATLCREMTKTHEQIVRGTLEELAAWAQHEVKGEITVVVAGAPAPDRLGNSAEWAAAVSAAEGQGRTRKEAIADTARAHGVPKREVYQAVLDNRGS